MYVGACVLDFRGNNFRRVIGTIQGRERSAKPPRRYIYLSISLSLSISIHIHIYIYTHICTYIYSLSMMSCKQTCKGYCPRGMPSKRRRRRMRRRERQEEGIRIAKEDAIQYKWYRCLWENIPFMGAFALQHSNRNCYPAPDLVLFKLNVPRVFVSGGVFHRHRYHTHNTRHHAESMTMHNNH